MAARQRWRQPALAGPPDQPRVIDGHRDRQARRRAADADRARARDPVLQYLRLRAPDLLRPGPQPRRPTSWPATRSRTAASSPCICARATNGPTASRSRPRTSGSTGRTSRPTRPARSAAPTSRCWPTASRPRSRCSDDLTVRYTWSKPNRFFIPALAAANQLFIYRPAHYLKQFHQKYADPEALKKLMAGRRCPRLGAAVPAQGPAQRFRRSGQCRRCSPGC